jgi:hypothetical protein
MNPDRRQYHDVKEVRRAGGGGGTGRGGLKLIRREKRRTEPSVCGPLRLEETILISIHIFYNSCHFFYNSGMSTPATHEWRRTRHHR